MKDCQSCGMPMEKAEDFGAGDVNGDWCSHCSNADGSHKTREEVRAGWIGFTMSSQGLSKEGAEKKVDEQMAQLPAWKE